MFNLIIFILGVIGITHIIVESTFLLPIREWLNIHYPKLYKLSTCYQCMGFWVGTVCGIPQYTLSPYLIFWIFLFGGAGSFLSVFGATLLDRLQR